MSVSKQQQEVIDHAISSFLKTNDVIGRQYLKLRQDALDVSQQIANEVAQKGKATPELILQLKKLEVEASQVSQTYENYLDRVCDTLKYSETHQPQYLLKLEKQYIALVDDRDTYNKHIATLREDSKAVVEKMAKLAQNFEKGISVKQGNKLRGISDVLTSKTSQPNPDSLLIDYASTIFEKKALLDMFADVDKKLRDLRTVDEISDENPTEPKLSSESAPSINIGKYLDELLQNNRAYFRMDDSNYSYEITRSTSIHVGTSSMNLDDYNVAIESLIKDIQGLVEGGALAKERWMSNARKLKMIQTVLQSLEDTEMELDG